MSTNDRVFHTSLGELATQPHPMGELVVGDRFVGPDETTVYEVTGDCASNNGSLRTRNLSMSADEAAMLAEAGDDPRDGVFIYPTDTHLHRVQLTRRWTTEIDGVLRGPAMTQPQAEDAWAKLAAEGYDVTVVDLDHQTGHADDHAEDYADYDVAGDAPDDPATTDPWRAAAAEPYQHSAGNDASGAEQRMEERWASEYGGPWDDPRADAAHREVEIEARQEQRALFAEDIDLTTRTDRALDRAEATCRRIDEVLGAEHDRAADQARAAELSRRHVVDREHAVREAADVRAVEVP